MALQKQTQSLPIVAGINQKEDALLTQRPTAMVNCLYRKSLAGGDKRFGHEGISPGAISDDPENLATCGDSLVGIGCGYLYEFDPYAAGGSGWVQRAKVPEAIVREQDIAVTALQLEADQSPDVAYCNGYIITLSYYEPASGTASINVDVVNATSGARVYTQYILDSAGAGETRHYPQLAVSGTTVGAFWLYDNVGSGVTRIEARFLDTTTMTWASKGTVVTGTASPGGLGGGIRPFAVDVISSTAWVVAYEDGGASGNDVRLAAVNMAFATTLGPLTFTASTTDVLAFAVKVTSSGVWVAYGDTSGDVYTARATLALVQSLARTLVTNGAFGGQCHNVTIAWDSNAYFEVFIACSYQGSSSWYIEFNGFTSAGATSHVANRVVWNVQLASKAFRVERTTGTGVYEIFAWVQNQHTTHTTHFLIDFYTNPTIILPRSTVCRVVATALPRYGYGRQVTRDATLSSVAALGTWDFITAAAVTLTDRRTRQIFGLRTLFHSEWLRTCVDTDGGLVIGGGAPTLFDGVYAWEIGFFNEPDLGAMATFTSSNSAGSLTNSGVYSYVAVYAVRDGRGNIHRSAPSVVKSVPTLGASDDTIQGTVPPLHLTNRSDSTTINGGTTVNPIIIELYRTVHNGSAYYFCQAIRNDPSSSTAIAFTDEMSDVTLAANAQLYTTGGVLDRTAPESAAIVHAHKGAVVLGDTASGNIWFSGELLDDEGLWFSESTTVAPFDGGRVTAMATMDQALIAFKTESIYGFDGEPPSDVGVSSLSPPRRVQSDVGCIDPNSVVGGDMGVFFYGRTGLALLTRGYAVEPIGKPIEDSYSSTTQARRFAGACLIPGQNLIRFVQYNESTAAALNYDYYHSKLYGTPVWSVDNFYDVTTGGAEKAYAACMWRNRFVYLTDGRTLIGEKSSSSSTAYLDTDYSGSTQTWVPMTVTSPAAKNAGVQGRQRVWRASVLGVKGSDHGASITLTSDLGTSTRTWTRTEVNAAVSGTNEQLQIHNDKQKCQWLSVTYTDSDPGSGNRGNGRGMTLRSFEIEFGVKPGLAKNIPQGARK